MVDRPKQFWRWIVALLFCIVLIFISSCGSAGVYHTVKPGQNLYRISKAYGVNESYLARINGISDPTRLQIGTRLYIPGANRVLSVPVVKTSDPPPKKPTTSLNPVLKPIIRQKPKPIVNTRPTDSKSPTTGVNKLRWPLRGKIVRSFSSKAKAGGGKGIEIAVRTGSDVTAAEAGKVIYSGDGVKGYGHLIILQHENDLFTVYGFNQRNLVRLGDFVSQGEKIALSGTPPSGGQPRLHFEVRKGKLAVDPILYLP